MRKPRTIRRCGIPCSYAYIVSLAKYYFLCCCCLRHLLLIKKKLSTDAVVVENEKKLATHESTFGLPEILFLSETIWNLAPKILFWSVSEISKRTIQLDDSVSIPSKLAEFNKEIYFKFVFITLLHWLPLKKFLWRKPSTSRNWSRPIVKILSKSVESVKLWQNFWFKLLGLCYCELSTFSKTNKYDQIKNPKMCSFNRFVSFRVKVNYFTKAWAQSCRVLLN